MTTVKQTNCHPFNTKNKCNNRDTIVYVILHKTYTQSFFSVKDHYCLKGTNQRVSIEYNMNSELFLLLCTTTILSIIVVLSINATTEVPSVLGLNVRVFVRHLSCFGTMSGNRRTYAVFYY